MLEYLLAKTILFNRHTVSTNRKRQHLVEAAAVRDRRRRYLRAFVRNRYLHSRHQRPAWVCDLAQYSSGRILSLNRQNRKDYSNRENHRCQKALHRSRSNTHEKAPRPPTAITPTCWLI